MRFIADVGWEVSVLVAGLMLMLVVITISVFGVPA